MPRLATSLVICCFIFAERYQGHALSTKNFSVLTEILQQQVGLYERFQLSTNSRGCIFISHTS